MEPMKIDAVRLVREIRDKQTAELKDKTPTEVIAYYHVRAVEFHKKLEKRAAEQPEKLTLSA